MGNLIDLTGQRFGKWVVIEKAKKPNESSAVWLCRCDCGNTAIVRGKDLRYAKSKSCGCGKVKHGEEGSRLYLAWRSMKNRCFNKNAQAYADYGGRGITVCAEWRDDFEAFRDWALASGYQDHLTLDRENNDGPYSPENCRWVTMKKQGNNRRSNRLATYCDETHTLTEWAEITGIPYPVLRNRISILGWPIEKAVETPVKLQRSREG